MIGEVIGNYRILSRLGEGGMGVVYAAEHLLLRRPAAIKVLRPELSHHTEVVERFFNEARAMTAVRDLGIVQVYDFGLDPQGRAFIVMELLEGEALDVRLRRGPLPARVALRIARQLATSLAVAHARGVVHRDLKPENVFLVPDSEASDGERPKVLDFGIAKLIEHGGVNQTRSGVFLGTPLYMSPEQCRGAGEVDHRSDIYSLGCVLFHMVCGHPPYDGGAGEILAMHIREPAPVPSATVRGLPAVVDEVVAGCLAKAPGDRYQSMTAVAQAVAAALARITAGTTGPGAATVMLDARGGAPMGPTTPVPTTLGGGAGATPTMPPLGRRSRAHWVVLVAAAVVAGAVAAMLALPGEPRVAIVEPPAPDAAIAATPPVDAGILFDAGVPGDAAAAVTGEPAPAPPATTRSSEDGSSSEKQKKKRERRRRADAGVSADPYDPYDPYAQPPPQQPRGDRGAGADGRRR